MVLYSCHFCDYTTQYITNFKNHIKKIKKCSHLIRDLKIIDLEDYNKLVELHKSEPDNKIWGIDVPKSKRIFSCEYCNRQYTRNSSVTRHLKKCFIKKAKEYINSL